MILLTFFNQTEFCSAPRIFKNWLSSKIYEKCHMIALFDENCFIAITMAENCQHLATHLTHFNLKVEFKSLVGLAMISDENLLLWHQKCWKSISNRSQKWTIGDAENEWILKTLQLHKSQKNFLVRTHSKREVFLCYFKISNANSGL